MVECNSVEIPNIYLNLNDQQQFRLNKTNEVQDCFIAEIKERELMSEMLSKYIASFDYFDKPFIILSGTSGSIFIALFATVIGTPVGTASASFSLAFSISTGIVKKLLKKITRNKKKEHNKIFMLARSESTSIKSKMSEVSINNEIGHEDFMTIINEERNYPELKQSIMKVKEVILKILI